MPRTGTSALPLGELGAVKPALWQSVCNNDDTTPRPRTVRIHVARTEWTDQLIHERLPAGVWWEYGDSARWIGVGDDAQCGALRFRYGSSGVQRMVICDLAAGEYVVPACEYLSVEATRYTPSANLARLQELGYTSEIEVSGEIVDGAVADYTPLVFTAVSSWPQGESAEPDYASVCACPPGAYSFELFADFPSAPNNTFEVSLPGALRSFENGVHQPVSPLPVVAPYVRVQCRGTEPQPCRIVFFVR
jgi:hypothetical protein